MCHPQESRVRLGAVEDRLGGARRVLLISPWREGRQDAVAASYGAADDFAVVSCARDEGDVPLL
jgi:hypothetical protein